MKPLWSKLPTSGSPPVRKRARSMRRCGGDRQSMIESWTDSLAYIVKLCKLGWLCVVEISNGGSV